MINLRSLNKALQSYDSCLFAQETKLGRADVYRKRKFDCNPPHFLFSLTDTWTPQGRPVEYGVLVVMDRVRALDLWRNDDFVEDYLKRIEKEKEEKDRDRRNNIESFLYEFRSQFHKATENINTSTLKKLHRKEGSHGYCEPRS